MKTAKPDRPIFKMCISILRRAAFGALWLIASVGTSSSHEKCAHSGTRSDEYNEIITEVEQAIATVHCDQNNNPVALPTSPDEIIDLYRSAYFGNGFFIEDQKTVQTVRHNLDRQITLSDTFMNPSSCLVRDAKGVFHAVLHAYYYDPLDRRGMPPSGDFAILVLATQADVRPLRAGKGSLKKGDAILHVSNRREDGKLEPKCRSFLSSAEIVQAPRSLFNGSVTYFDHSVRGDSGSPLVDAKGAAIGAHIGGDGQQQALGMLNGRPVLEWRSELVHGQKTP